MSPYFDPILPPALPREVAPLQVIPLSSPDITQAEIDAVTAVLRTPHLSQVDAIIGNSSSGIMEAASFALPTVNVGLRQQGRERARNLIDAPPETSAILSALNQALEPEFRRTLRGMENPYGDGTAAETIARVLTTVPLDGLLIKQPAPLPAESRNVDER